MCNNLVSEAARPDADFVRVQRVDRLCARWRERAATCRKIANNLRDVDRTLSCVWLGEAETLENCINDFDREWAGTEPIDSSSPTKPA